MNSPFFVTGNGNDNNKHCQDKMGKEEAGKDEAGKDEAGEGKKTETSAPFLEEQEEDETEGENNIAEITKEMATMKLKGPPAPTGGITL